MYAPVWPIGAVVLDPATEAAAATFAAQISPPGA
ncbi:hypothetical protein FRACA_90007 [Frankia canadensis]|uniref:Uncharacterized protein n=1 Tax=Frankia canadensis TaxID=1836972 RepID=A0A2I2L259_9ACTN|nr:hypothetical protein FRACA_90007 [Frankia canadensis]SOU59294.1 hypothetical protein FRACA_90007 [Frankia canadensis]